MFVEYQQQQLLDHEPSIFLRFNRRRNERRCTLVLWNRRYLLHKRERLPLDQRSAVCLRRRAKRRQLSERMHL